MHKYLLDSIKEAPDGQGMPFIPHVSCAARPSWMLSRRYLCMPVSASDCEIEPKNLHKLYDRQGCNTVSCIMEIPVHCEHMRSQSTLACSAIMCGMGPSLAAKDCMFCPHPQIPQQGFNHDLSEACQHLDNPCKTPCCMTA